MPIFDRIDMKFVAELVLVGVCLLLSGGVIALGFAWQHHLASRRGPLLIDLFQDKAMDEAINPRIRQHHASP